MQELTEEQAIALAQSEFWHDMTAKQIAEFQLHTDRLCMPFDVFHKAVEDALGRSVWTHEFAFREKLCAELSGEASSPTFQQILELIPEEKRIILVLDQ